MTIERCAYLVRGGRSRNAVGVPCGAVAVGEHEGLAVCGTHRAQLRSRARDHELRENFAREQEAERAARDEVAAMLPGATWRDKADALRGMLPSSAKPARGR